ncbi:MAG: J domain-containing protein [Fimbriimonadales bacterium]|nr:J domain-containing protein [Fimbriimonadales bacterium]
MALGRRLSRLMKAHWNELLERVEGVLREEEAELAARQAASQELSGARQSALQELDNVPQSPRPEPSPDAAGAPQPATETAVRRAYRVLGLPEDADLATVRRTYRDLIARSDPNRFPENSPEREKARQIQQRIEQAYQTLLLHLDHSAQRFRNLSVE